MAVLIFSTVTVMNLLRYAQAALAALSLASAAQAAVISNPDGIVDNGAYITDNNTGLQWYKFRPDIGRPLAGYSIYSDPNSTIGKKFSDVVSPASVFSQAGWKAATVEQVSNLWSRFGWSGSNHTSCNPGCLPNIDAGLTDAIAQYLGYTYGFDFGSANYIRDVIGVATDSAAQSGIVQAELMIAWDVSDYVQLRNQVNTTEYSWFGAGTYLVREVPNPASLSLLLFVVLVPVVSKSAARKKFC